MNSDKPFFAAAGVFAVLVIMLILISVDMREIRLQAIERGYALHCPIDGRFAWKGECDK